MENIFYELINNRMDDCLDVEGRPLGEQRVPEIYDTIKTRKIKCQYPGSRFLNANLMNVSALKQIRQNKNEILYLLSQLRNDVLRQENKITYLDAWEIVTRATLLPLFLKMKGDEKIPIYASGLYKVAFGLVSVMMKLALKEIIGKKIPLDSSYVWRCAEESGELVGSKEVCAAPEKLIREVVNSFLDTETLQSEKISIPSLDIKAFLKFSKYSVHFHFCFIAYLIYIRNLYFPFDFLKDQKIKEEYEHFQKEMKEKQDESSIPPVYQIESLLSYEKLKIFNDRLNEKYFPDNIKLYKIEKSIDVNKKEKKEVYFSFIIKNEMNKLIRYETQQIKAFNLFLTKASNISERKCQTPLTFNEMKKVIKSSPVVFFERRY